MKILIINWQDIKNPFGGGAEVHMHEIFKRLAAKGHDITLFCCEYENSPKEEIIDGIRVIRHGKRSTFNFGVKNYYIKHFKDKGFDIVIDDINKIPFYLPRFVKEPILGISHHFFGISIFRETNPISGLYVYLSEKLVDCVYKKTQMTVVSQSTLDEFIERGFNKENFTIIENAIEPNDFPMKVGIKNPYPTITYFGRLKKYKSPDHLLKAFAKVKINHTNAQLYIMGRGDFMDTMKSLAIELGINDSTTFFGFVTEEQKKELLTKSWVAVNTSMKEGWGITNIEANACGTAVISANVPGLRDSVSEGISGELYEYGNIDELAKQIEHIIGSNDALMKYSKGAVDWANRFSWDKSAELMLQLIKKVTGK
jgi:glycosyltransferase involved in cell wall biosynthesis